MLMINVDQNKYTVYVHISPSKKYYVGLTSLKPNFRWGRNGHGYQSQYFSRAIRKYGWDNFEHIIVAEELPKEEACTLEKMLINALQSNNHKYGYNITDGGDGTDGFHHTEEAKEKIAKALSRPIDQYDLNGNYIKSWDSAQIAAKELNLDGSAILKCCNGKYHSSKGYVWRYKGEPFDKYMRKKYQQPLQRKHVDQYTTTGEFVKNWDSFAEIKDHLNLSSNSAIVLCCQRKRKTAYGYVWRYEGDSYV